MYIVYTCLCLALAGAMYYYVYCLYDELEYVRSDTDGIVYMVQRLSDKQDAANQLGRLNLVAQKLIAHLRQKYPADDRVLMLVENYSPEALQEGRFLDGLSSYSVNKGEHIVMCVRKQDGVGSLVPSGVATYVLLHELAHVATREMGHTPRFWENFKFLVDEAVSLGMYTVTDYSKDPQEYCGITISSNVAL